MAVSDRFKRYFPVLVFPCLGLVLIIFIVSANQQIMENRNAVMYKYLKSVSQGNIGYGSSDYYNNDISFAGLEPGDIILGVYPDCAYGHFSHAGIYIGDSKVMEGYVDLGINIQPVDNFRRYSGIYLLHVNLAPAIKQRAVNYVKKLNGRMFYPAAFKPGERIWNCTKLMWKAYAMQGIDLDSNGDLWISPDAFYNNPRISLIREKVK